MKLLGGWLADRTRIGSCSDLAAITNAEEAFMGEYSSRLIRRTKGVNAGRADICLDRMLIHFASMGILNEVDIDKYSRTPFVAALAEPRYSSWINFT